MLGIRLSQLDPRLAAVFLEEERAGVRLAVQVRLAALGIIAVWVAVRAAGPARLYYLSIIALFALIAVGHLLLGRRWHPAALTPARFALVLLEMALLAYTFVVPNPLAPEGWPVAMQLRLGNFDFFFVFMAFAVLSFSPGLALWAGIATALVWSLGTIWVIARPDAFTVVGATLLERTDLEGLLAVLLDPDYVSLEIWIQQVIAALVVAAVLAVAVARSRRLALRQAALARERTNLSRYFSPDRAEALARSDLPVGHTREQPVAVLFADIRDFTRMCTAMPPERVIDLLREFHRRMARTVFEHGGTLEKYIGDAVMATFGTPRPGPDDARRALACCLAMLDAVRAWNVERARTGEPPIRIGIGAHYGRVVLGDIGDERCMEFAVIGDAVNIASRLEHLCRDIDAAAIMSDDLVRQARATGPDALPDAVAPAEAQRLKGRDQPVRIWTVAAGTRADRHEKGA